MNYFCKKYSTKIKNIINEIMQSNYFQKMNLPALFIAVSTQETNQAILVFLLYSRKCILFVLNYIIITQYLK